ncbi:hypothetical protein SYJ56_08570 [Algoriphagus sp. D3-2-R+10]|uniref:hypothetical protein n=1 Tax=Algoriphagus aurantiacus TaxID=3103948 RepID=UPI002B3B721D|nr:hypothetical protein [Algoriphagus sp. D3-2-R+10]MEB2775359.1 hypothetical protein [Algoriphagus sp. D3-2-R+10]
MEKTIYKYVNRLRLASVLILLTLMFACEKDDQVPAPIITEVRNYDASPNDTVVNTINTGQWVVIMGRNLSQVAEVYFGSTPAAINNTFLTEASLVVQIPAIPFDSIPGDKINEIRVVNPGGIATYTISIIGEPLISYIRNFDASPNDTISSLISPGQHINMIGFNLKDPTSIAFQGVSVDLASVVYTDSSAIVKVPEDFSEGDASLSNRITYTTEVGTLTYFIPIFDPSILEYYSDPLWEMLTGGIGSEKTWGLDFNAEGVSEKFKGPLFFSGDGWGWGNQCAIDGGNCWIYDPEWQTWMPAPKDYGTMTFKLKGSPVPAPIVTVNQKGLTDAKNGVSSGEYFLDLDKKTITFTGVSPLNMGSEPIFVKATIITLTEDGMQLGFKHPNKAEFEIYNYIPK